MILGGIGEAEAVGCGQASVAVRTLHELVTETGAPLRGVGGGLGDGLQVEAAGVVATDFDGEGVVEAEGRAHGQIESRGIFGFHAGVDILLGACGILFEDGSEGGAGVFGVNVDASAENGLVADVAAGEIEAALDREVSLVFDLLGDDFAEDELFGEVFGADDDAGLAGGAAGGEE